MRRGDGVACLVRAHNSKLPLSPWGRARARVASAVRGKRFCRVKRANRNSITIDHPLTLPAMRLAQSFARARSRQEALSPKGRGDAGSSLLWSRRFKGESGRTLLCVGKRTRSAHDQPRQSDAFLSLVGRIVPWLTAATLILLGIGLYLSLFVAPPDYQQGETVKIMFIHVPSAWLAMFGYMLIAAAALGTLIWRHPLADVAAKTAAPIGATFTFIALVTGSLWGKPMWGTYWVWDARLTSVLVLFLLYLGLIALWNAIEEPGRAGRAAAILALVGAVNVPIIHYSVVWWNTLHQPASVFRIGGPTIDPALLTPLLVMALAFTLLFVLLHLIAMRAEILRRRVQALQRTQVEQAAFVEA